VRGGAAVPPQFCLGMRCRDTFYPQLSIGLAAFNLIHAKLRFVGERIVLFEVQIESVLVC